MTSSEEREWLRRREKVQEALAIVRGRLALLDRCRSVERGTSNAPTGGEDFSPERP